MKFTKSKAGLKQKLMGQSHAIFLIFFSPKQLLFFSELLDFQNDSPVPGTPGSRSKILWLL